MSLERNMEISRRRGQMSSMKSGKFDLDIQTSMNSSTFTNLVYKQNQEIKFFRNDIDLFVTSIIKGMKLIPTSPSLTNQCIPCRDIKDV